MKNFGSRLRACRKAKGFTQEELGKMVGMSSQKISNLERGYTTGLGADDISHLAALLQTTADYLLGRANTPSLNADIYSDADIKFALFGDIDIDDDIMAEVKAYAEFVADRKKREKK